MDRHPDSDTLQAFREHRLSGSAVAEVAVHVGRCAQCSRVEPSAGRTALDALIARGADDHLTDEELDVLVDRRVDDPSYRMISRHAAACAMCRAEVEDLRRFDAGSTGRWPVGLPDAGQSRRAVGGPAGEPPVRRWAIAAAVVFTVLALSAIAVLLRWTTPEEAPVVTASNPTPTTPVERRAEAAPYVNVVASVADGNGRIELREDGTIAGVEVRDPRDAEDARAVLSGRSIAIPTFIVAMPGAVRGGDGGPRPLRAIAPSRTAVLHSRPRFSWTAVPGARSYRVAVFDANYDEIVRSEPLTETSWIPPRSLPPGVDLSWHVTAETDAGELSSAGSDRTEAVFRVLARNDVAAVEQGLASYSDSHLMRGLLYSRHGLLHDARQEFRALAKQNPGSPVARALLESVD